MKKFLIIFFYSNQILMYIIITLLSAACAYALFRPDDYEPLMFLFFAVLFVIMLINILVFLLLRIFGKIYTNDLNEMISLGTDKRHLVLAAISSILPVATCIYCFFVQHFGFICIFPIILNAFANAFVCVIRGVVMTVKQYL